MSRIFIPILATAVLLTGTSLAAEPALGVKLGSSATEIGAALGSEGYDMTKYEREHGRIEVTAIKEQRQIKAYVDAATGEVVEIASREGGGQWARPGAKDEQIRTSLAAQGYEIVKYEREQGEIEVYALKDGRRWELKIDPRNGRVLRAEEED